jgi:hypothetical protein
MYRILKALCNSQTDMCLGKLPIVQRILFCKLCNFCKIRSQNYVMTDNQSASLNWCQASISVRDQLFFLLENFLRQLWVCYFVVHILTRGRVCSLLLLLGLASAVPLGSESRSESHFTAASQSVCLGVKPTWWTFDQILLPFKSLGLEFVVLSVEHHLWWEAGSVLCKSQSSHLSVCTFTINIFVFHTFIIYIYTYTHTHYIIYLYTRPLLVLARYSRLCPTTH